jgi:hypothetical protein
MGGAKYCHQEKKFVWNWFLGPQETSEDVTIVLVWDVSVMFRERHGVRFEQLNMVREIYRPRVQGGLMKLRQWGIMRMWSLLILNYRAKKYSKPPL